MDCQTFLDGYTAFRDDDLSWDERVEFEVHLDECERCARYDRVVRRGTDVLRDLPEVEVSDDFGARLQHRIFHLDDERARARSGVGAGTLAMAAAIAAVAWVPLVGPRETLLQLPAVAATAPRSGGVVDRLTTVHHEATPLTSRLAEVGVAVRELPYHDVLFRPDGPLVGQLAGYTPPAGDAPVPYAQ
ncbi:MAG TPA: zf-HC2 domain-containing protein [Longimicrobium sp.]|nr:zf-HC2 domain-containing protein [Longimicrobium sp.]